MLVVDGVFFSSEDSPYLMQISGKPLETSTDASIASLSLMNGITGSFVDVCEEEMLLRQYGLPFPSCS